MVLQSRLCCNIQVDKMDKQTLLLIAIGFVVGILLVVIIQNIKPILGIIFLLWLLRYLFGLFE